MNMPSPPDNAIVRPGEGTTPAGEWGDWLHPQQVWERVLQVWRPEVMPERKVPLAEAFGRVLAADVRAPVDSPAFDRSAMDGYAVRSVDVRGAAEHAPAHLRFVGEAPMGVATTVVVGPTGAVWVATGSMMPRGADSVVMVERTARHGDDVLIHQEAAPGDNVVRRGDDLHAGDVVLLAGQRLRPQDLAALASMGFGDVPVREHPRVAIISSGDELASPGTPLGPGQIYDANSYAMAAQVTSWGGTPWVLPRARDRFDEMLAMLREAVAGADVVLLSGGSSVGIKDLTARTIDAAGTPGVVVHGVAMRPGRPTVLGVVDRTLVIGIPGNPVSAMISCGVFARPAVDALLGSRPVREAGVVGEYSAFGRLSQSIRSQVGRQDYIRVRVERDGDTAMVSPVPGGSSVIRSMVEADGLVMVAPERASLDQGDVVDVRLF